MRADSRERLLISPQHAEETPTLRRKNDTCGARLQLVCAEICAGARRDRDERSETEGDFLWHTEVKLAESEIIDLRVAEAGARSTSRRRVRDDWRVDVHDLLNARDSERNQNSRFAVFGVIVQAVQRRRVVVSVLQRKLRFRGIVCRIGAAALARISIDGFLSIIRVGRYCAGKKA